MADAFRLKHRVVYHPKDYRIQELIGSGSFSEVFKAVRIDNNKVIALKSLRHGMHSRSNYRHAAKEIAFLQILEHPHILQLEFFTINKTFVYIGMEYAPFGSLRKYLHDKKPVAENIIQNVMKQLLAALDYLHTMGIFHGDVKPENILCTNISNNGPVIKICDFGLTEINLFGEDSVFYNAGSFMYMAPEVHLQYPVDCSCDMWSAGIIMYTMMFNRYIFVSDEREREKYMQFLKRRVQPNYNGSEAYSPECNNLVRNLLSYDKHVRLMGQKLRIHPFVNIADPKIPQLDDFLATAQDDIHEAYTVSSTNDFGAALVQATRAAIKMKIFFNLTPNPEHKATAKDMWMRYEEYASRMEGMLMKKDNELYCPKHCSDSDFRLFLASTPKLLDGFDMGCNAEMFMREGRKEKALNLFHQALQTILPLMKNEPKSNRKDILGRKVKKWIQYVEDLTENKEVGGPSSGSSRDPVKYTYVTSN